MQLRSLIALGLWAALIAITAPATTFFATIFVPLLALSLAALLGGIAVAIRARRT